MRYHFLSIALAKNKNIDTIWSWWECKLIWPFWIIILAYFFKRWYYLQNWSRFIDRENKFMASLVAQLVKNLPAMPETWIWSLGWEDPLEKRTAIHSSILTWRIPWTEEPGRLQSMGSQKVEHDWATFTFTFFQREKRRER